MELYVENITDNMPEDGRQHYSVIDGMAMYRVKVEREANNLNMFITTIDGEVPDNETLHHRVGMAVAREMA